MAHIISLSIADGEDADFLKRDIIPCNPGLTLLGFAVDPNPGSFYTAYILASTEESAVRLADTLGVGTADIIMADLVPVV